MASAGPTSSSCTNRQDQGSSAPPSSALAPAPAKGKGPGRPKHYIRQEFSDIGSSSNSSHRTGVQCKHCNQSWTAGQAKNEVLIKHILEQCGHIPAGVRSRYQLLAAGQQASSKAGEQAATAGVKRTASQAGLDRFMPTKAWELTKAQKLDVDFHFLRWAVCSNIPFKAFDSPHLHAALAALRPTHVVPAPTTFKDQLLQKEFLGVLAKLKKRIADARNLTLTADGWTDQAKRSVLAFVLLFPDGSAALLEARELSADKHTAELLADVFKEVIDKHGLRTKLALLCTDNAANMLKARQLVVATDGFGHILEIRCAMHAFNLVLGSVLAFPWAQDLVVSAQRVVTYFRASHQPMALLRAAAERFDIKSGLRSSNATRFTSKHECIKSVLANQAAFTLVLQNNRGVINNADVLAILDDTTFWADAAKLEKVLAPLSAVITVVQGNGTTLADVCRCWLYLVKDLGAVLDALPVDYQEHIIWAVSTRAKQQDDVLPRLALFLDPRFREAARATSDAAMTEFTEWLCEYAAAQGWAAPRITSVLGQLAQYGRGQPPFNLARASGTIFGTFSARGWWEVVGSNPAAADLAELATALFEVVPHAAAPERAFSTMGWYEGGKATRLAAGTNAQKTAIKMHYDTFKPKQDNKPAAATEVPDTVDLSGPAHIDAGALSDTAAAAAARAAAESQRSSNSSSGGGGGSGAGQQQQADAGEEAEEEATPEDVQAALAKQQEADRREREVLEVPEECRRDWRAAMKWATGAQQGADLLNPSYQEVPRGAQPREIGARQAGVDTAAILRQFRQQEQEAATAAAAAAAAAQQAVAAAAQQAGTAVDYVELLRQQAVLSALAQQGGAGHPQAGAAQQGGF